MITLGGQLPDLLGYAHEFMCPNGILENEICQCTLIVATP